MMRPTFNLPPILVTLAVAVSAFAGCALFESEAPTPESPTSYVVTRAHPGEPHNAPIAALRTAPRPGPEPMFAEPGTLAVRPAAYESAFVPSPGSPSLVRSTPADLSPMVSAPPNLDVPPALEDGRFGLPSTTNRAASVPSEVVPPPLHATDSPFPNATPIDLGSALLTAAGQNPRVAFAQERVREAYAQWQAARTMWLPSLRAGMNYNKHEGRIQDVAGTIIDTSRGSFYTGLGAQAVGASSPAVPGLVVNMHLRDALFNPRIADRLTAAEGRASAAAVNDLLLETSLAYIDLLEAMQTKAVAEETLTNAERLATTTASFARVGQGLDADADRAQVELALRRVEARRAVEAVRTASSRLARLLSRDQAQTYLPTEPEMIPIDLVDLSPGMSELTAIGLSMRPELAESRLLVAAAVERLRRERAAPLIPSVLLGTSYGGNGGGLGGNFSNFGDRFDFDAAAYWEVRNLGAGEQAQRAAARSRVQQATQQRLQRMDQVAAEIAEAFVQVESRKMQVADAQHGIAAAADSLRRNVQRIEQGQGLPIETLQAVQALDQARRLYVRSVADYNRAQFRLQRAIGWPVLNAAATSDAPAADAPATAAGK